MHMWHDKNIQSNAPSGPILESKGICAIFQNMGKEIMKKGKIFDNLGKMYKLWTYFEKKAGVNM